MKDYRLVMSDTFMDSYDELPKAERAKVRSFFSKFSANPMRSGLNYEKLNGIDKNMRSLRIDIAYRTIVWQDDESNAVVLLWVDHHDEAYAWAEKKRLGINYATGGIQIFTSVSQDEIKQVPHNIPMLFDFLSDDQLIKLGVPTEQIILIRSFENVSDFIAAEKKIPKEPYNALDLALGGDSIDDILDVIYGDIAHSGSADIVDIFDNPVTKMHFAVIEGEEELQAMMDAPMEKWRVFLHPSQRSLVSRNFSGPARVLGGAGTGKTVVAMHRAKYLASLCRDNERVLVTTYNVYMAQDIEENLRKICSADELRRIEVINLDAWVDNYLKQNNLAYSIQFGDVITNIWKKAISSAGQLPDLPANFYEEEWNAVVQTQGVNSQDGYLKALRAGRSIRLDRAKRTEVWNVFEKYMKLLETEKVWDIAYATNQVADIVCGQDAPVYKSIVVDEGQDLGSWSYRLIRALAGEVHENDLFIVGDAHQRIYKNKASLSKCGIAIRGRSSRLKINYRTTEEIKNYAMHVLKDISFDDLDGGSDTEKGYRSLSHGDMPTISNFEKRADEINELIAQIKQKLTDGVDPMEICVVLRTNQLLNTYNKAFQDAGIRTFEVKKGKSDDTQLPGVRISTMHRVKGLEFSYIYVAGLNKVFMPLMTKAVENDPVAREEAIKSERCLMYVALTRAKKAAYISSYGEASEFIR